MKTFRFATISAAVSLASLVSVHTVLAADTPVRINQAFQSLLYLPLYVAQEQGFFKQQGVEVKISTGGGGAQSWYPFAFSSLTTTQQYIDKNPQAAQAVVTAFEQASRFIYKHQEESVQIARKYFPALPEAVVKKAVQREIDAKGYPENVLVSQKAWDNNMNIALYAKNIKAYPSEATSYQNNVNVELATKAKAAVDAMGDK